MKDTDDTRLSRFHYHGTRILFGVTSVHDNRQACFSRDTELFGECPSLLGAWRVVVVIVETAFSNRDRTRAGMLADIIDVAP